ncbi:MAG: hypothetical protein ACYCYF_07875 [Anaerolineae bacterium]
MSAMRVLRTLSLVLALLLVAVLGVSAQFADQQDWVSAITYYTPSDTPGVMVVTYYAADGTAYSTGEIDLLPHKAGSLYIGSVSSVPAAFSGSAVMSASVPLVATYAQFVSGAEGPNYGRMIYNGFDASAAAQRFYIPTILYQAFGTTSTVGIQNIEGTPITARLSFYAVGNPTAVAVKDVPIPAFSSYIFGPVDIPELSPGFTGSLVITTNETGGGLVVAAAEETLDAGRAAYAFEGVAQGANKFYMPSMQCRAFSSKHISYYAIQNAGTGNASVTITYYDLNGNIAGTMPATIIPEGGKLSTNPCLAGVPNGSWGSAVIESTGAEIIAIGKVVASDGMMTAFVGQSAGSTSLAAPYVRWSADPSAEFRTYLAVMNVGGAAATNITAKYYDGAGDLVATEVLASPSDPLPQYTKTNTSASTAGALTAAYGDFGIHPFGGAVEFSSDQPIVVLARNQRTVSLGSVTMFAEDYNAVAPPAP